MSPQETKHFFVSSTFKQLIIKQQHEKIKNIYIKIFNKLGDQGALLFSQDMGHNRSSYFSRQKIRGKHAKCKQNISNIFIIALECMKCLYPFFFSRVFGMFSYLHVCFDMGDKRREEIAQYVMFYKMTALARRKKSLY